MILGLILLGLTPNITHGWSFKSAVSGLFNLVKENPLFGLALACKTALLWNMFREPIKETPTLDKLKIKTHESGHDQKGYYVKTTKGIRGCGGTVILFCHGCIPHSHGFGESTVKGLIERAIIPLDRGESVRCISFEFDDSRSTLNLGQDYDQRCLDVVYKAVKDAGNHKIILMGLSRGSLAIENYLGNQEVNDNKFSGLEGVVLLEPPTQPTIKEITGSAIKDWAARLIYPNYNANYQKGIMLATSFAKPEVPIFIGYIEGDGHARNMKEFIKNLRILGCSNIYEYVSKEKLTHGSMMNDPRLRLILNAFYFMNFLPFDNDIMDKDVGAFSYNPDTGARKDEVNRVWSFLTTYGRHYTFSGQEEKIAQED